VVTSQRKVEEEPPGNTAATEKDKNEEFKEAFIWYKGGQPEGKNRSFQEKGETLFRPVGYPKTYQKEGRRIRSLRTLKQSQEWHRT